MQAPELQSLPVGQLHIDSDVQRGLDRRWSKSLAEILDPNVLAAKPFIVSLRRPPPLHIVIDGQHRREAAIIRFGLDYRVSCLVYKGLTKQEEANLFRQANNSRKVAVIDMFLVRVTGNDPVATSINDMLNSYGWRVYSGAHADGHFAAVHSLERIYIRDPYVAEETIATLTKSWGHTNGTMDAKMVEGIALVFARYGPEINKDRFIEKLSRYSGGPVALLRNAKGLKDLRGGTIPVAVAEIAVNQYNSRARTGQLPPWNSLD